MSPAEAADRIKSVVSQVARADDLEEIPERDSRSGGDPQVLAHYRQIVQHAEMAEVIDLSVQKSRDQPGVIELRLRSHVIGPWPLSEIFNDLTDGLAGAFGAESVSVSGCIPKGARQRE